MSTCVRAGTAAAAATAAAQVLITGAAREAFIESVTVADVQALVRPTLFSPASRATHTAEPVMRSFC